jgi:hypothetical protein
VGRAWPSKSSHRQYTMYGDLYNVTAELKRRVKATFVRTEPDERYSRFLVSRWRYHVAPRLLPKSCLRHRHRPIPGRALQAKNIEPYLPTTITSTQSPIPRISHSQLHDYTMAGYVTIAIELAMDRRGGISAAGLRTGGPMA